LEPADVWCADVLTWPQLLAHPAYAALGMTQSIQRQGGDPLLTTRCPIRIDGGLLTASRGAPRLGEDTAAVAAEFGLDGEGVPE
jgi:CoA:oxalate CoA-transferase